MRLTRYLLMAAVLFLGALTAAPERAAAASPHHPHWTLCRLTFNGQGGFVSKTCNHYLLLKQTRRPIGHTWREIDRTPALSVRVTWPVFANPLAGCAPSIRQWAPYVQVAHQATGVPVWVIAGVIGAESGGTAVYATTPDGWGGPGDIGLMQFGLREANLVHATYGFGSFSYDPEQNILTGTGYLLWLYQHYGRGSWDWTVQTYNGGPATAGRPDYLAAVLRWSCD